MFDWLYFLDRNNIKYLTSGPNVSGGNIAIHCPYCGPADESEHMTVSLKGKGFACWRNSQHKGKNPARLVSKILGISLDSATRMIGGTVQVPTDFLARVNQALLPQVKAPAHSIVLPPEFMELKPLPSAQLVYRYLEKRGFDLRDFPWMSKHYGLRYCTRGAYKGRVIFPVYYEKKLVTWTGRSVYPSEELRYRTLSTDDEKSKREGGWAPAIGPTSDYLLWYDDLMKSKADTIYIVEGPFDALKVRYLGEDYGIVATCLFTSRITTAQIDKCHELLPRFKHRFVMLDRGAFPSTMRIARALQSLGVQAVPIPQGVKDPGELSSHEPLKMKD